MINSCNDDRSCRGANGNGAFNELIGCCNDFDYQCEDLVGFDIVNAGCVSYMFLMLVKKSYNSLFFYS